MIWTAHNVTPQINIDRFYSFFEVHYDHGYDFPGESHNFWECVYVLEGNMCVSGDDRVYNLEQDQIIFHKPLELHKSHIDNPEGATLLIFSFSMEGNMASHLKNKVFRLSESQKKICSSMLDYMRDNLAEHFPSQTGGTKNYILPFEDTQTYPQMLATYLYQLFLSLIDNGKISRVSMAPDALLFSKAVNYIHSQVCGQPSVREIARACNTSESTLKRIFKKYSGISIHKYSLELKIKTATELLQNGSSVTEVADRLGFSSQAYFSTCYKRETGIYPTQVE